MNEKTQKRITFLVNIVFFGVILAIIYIFFKYILALFTPFIIGLVIAFLVEPVVRFLNDKYKLNRKFASLAMTFIVWFIVVFIVFKLGQMIISQATNLLAYIQTLNISSLTTDLNAFITDYIDDFAPDLIDPITSAINQLVGQLIPFVREILTNLVNFALKVPNMFIIVIVSVVSSVLITIDLPKIKQFIFLQMPAGWRTEIIESRTFIFQKILSIIRAYMIIISITFLELLIGLLVLNVKYAALMALMIAVLDALPLFGTATFLVPWTIYAFISGDVTLGIGLIIILIVVTVVREIVTPRIVGQQMGMHPLITLMCMYVGFQSFGVLGLFGFPLILIFIKNLNDAGRIKVWKNLPEKPKKKRTIAEFVKKGKQSKKTENDENIDDNNNE